MELITAFLIALSLSFDSFAVSISFGLCPKTNQISLVKYKIASILALFQGIAPFLGWLLGNSFKAYIKSYDHWIAFGLLLIIGGKMIWENRKPDHIKKPLDPSKLHVLIVAAIATSIDALMVGLSFAIIEVNIYVFLILTALITFLAALLGLNLAKKARIKWGSKLEIAGGMILIAIGIKVLIEHLSGTSII